MDEFEEEKKSPLRYFIALFLIIILVLMIFPKQIIKLDPRPEYIPTVEEAFIFDYNLSKETRTLKSREDFLNFVVPEDPTIKTTANRIASLACSGKKVCHAKAIYSFVKDNFDYISDPINFEYVELPQDFMASGGGDCESGTLLMANLMEAVGIDSQLVFIPGHAFLRIKLPEALGKYKLEDDWVYLDWTCRSCEFGEIPIYNINIPRTYIDVS